MLRACARLSWAISNREASHRGRPRSYDRQLKLLPLWDPLPGDPRFEKVIADLAPKE
jgi:hypothetical protein